MVCVLTHDRISKAYNFKMSIGLKFLFHLKDEEYIFWFEYVFTF